MGLRCWFMNAWSWILQVTIFEAQPTLGLDAHSMSVAGARVDAPLRTFNRAHYRNLTALYDLLNIDYGLANYCFSAVDLDLQSMFFRYYNFLLGKRSISYPWPFTRESWGKKYFQILRDFVRFWVYGRRDINNGALTGLTFGEYLQHRGFSRVFIQGVLFPMLCGKSRATPPVPNLLHHFLPVQWFVHAALTALLLTQRR